MDGSLVRTASRVPGGRILERATHMMPRGDAGAVSLLMQLKLPRWGTQPRTNHLRESGATPGDFDCRAEIYFREVEESRYADGY